MGTSSLIMVGLIEFFCALNHAFLKGYYYHSIWASSTSIILFSEMLKFSENIPEISFFSEGKFPMEYLRIYQIFKMKSLKLIN
jgi:hypothetical protein